MYSVKMMDMGKTPAEIKEESALYDAPLPVSSMVNRYPYGLCISLSEDELTKLGLSDEKPDVGDMIHLFAMARVTSVSENEKSDGTKSCRVEMQITHLGVEDENMEGMEEEAA